jgi:pantetheine-phosphate adenylyltransferase
MSRFALVAVGGTFDHLHVGHKSLLSKAFQCGDRVILGVTSDSFLAKSEKNLSAIQPFEVRVSRLREFLSRNGFLDRCEIIELDDPYGPLIRNPKIEAVAVSRETAARAAEANVIRASKGQPKLELCVIDLVLAEDARPISSRRIRNKEIDEVGNLIRP